MTRHWAAGPGLVHPTVRRWCAVALTTLSVATLVTISAGLLTASVAPWRFVRFIPFERPAGWIPVAVTAVAGLVAAGWLGLRTPAVRRAVTGFGTVAVLLTLCAGAAANVGSVLAGDPAQAPAKLVATTGGLELVAHLADQRHYRLRTTGPFAREGTTDVACTAHQSEQERADVEAPPDGTHPPMMPAVRVESARFPDPTHLELTTTDGRTWTVRINGVNPDRTLDWCGRRSDEPR
ncbi:hypothetical protein AB0J72_39360 [Dactylosporangium sp. NPDC049742]|uniref:hypothetical protein n=1 Tax=Dactylosporangium sp. NPDC049742 TaxID=3154737 RepID=UPI0034226EC2